MSLQNLMVSFKFYYIYMYVYMCLYIHMFIYLDIYIKTTFNNLLKQDNKNTEDLCNCYIH
jgi:hypothetical protein